MEQSKRNECKTRFRSYTLPTWASGALHSLINLVLLYLPFLDVSFSKRKIKHLIEKKGRNPYHVVDYFSCFSESPETIQSLNPWVKIPEDWKNHVDESITSSEEFYASSAQVHSSSGSREGKSDIEPYFDHAVMTNVSEHLGSHAFLRCRIKNLGDKTVSWKKFI